jgi:CubicO group peptidase (beta-lactamase class C family)
MRRRVICPPFCLFVAIVLLSLLRVASAAETADKPVGITGIAVPDLKAVDDQTVSLMRKWGIPGGAVAVVKDGRLVLAHGYGWADRDARKAVQPDSLFRIASVTKPITAAAILALVERGKLDLDAKVLDVLKLPGVSAEKAVDKRWKQITIRQLLFHTAGFDRDASFDPMFRSYVIAKATDTKPPASPVAIIRYMLGQRLDFDPGTKHAYSNFGYCLLGRVIEQVTGKTYGEAVQELVLQPCGITRMKIGRTRLCDRAADEVCYYPSEKDEARSVFPDIHGRVPWPDGGFYLEAMDAHGAWIASAIDLVRFASAMDGSRKPGPLKPATARLVESRPPAPLPADAAAYYGFGWWIRWVGHNANWSHNGSLPGTMTLLVRAHNGLKWAILVNLRPEDDGKFMGEMDRGMWKAVGKVSKWPEGDLFKRY